MDGNASGNRMNAPLEDEDDRDQMPSTSAQGAAAAQHQPVEHLSRRSTSLQSGSNRARRAIRQDALRREMQLSGITRAELHPNVEPTNAPITDEQKITRRMHAACNSVWNLQIANSTLPRMSQQRLDQQLIRSTSGQNPSADNLSQSFTSEPSLMVLCNASSIVDPMVLENDDNIEEIENKIKQICIENANRNVWELTQHKYERAEASDSSGTDMDEQTTSKFVKNLNNLKEKANHYTYNQSDQVPSMDLAATQHMLGSRPGSRAGRAGGIEEIMADGRVVDTSSEVENDDGDGGGVAGWVEVVGIGPSDDEEGAVGGEEEGAVGGAVSVQFMRSEGEQNALNMDARAADTSHAMGGRQVFELARAQIDLSPMKIDAVRNSMRLAIARDIPDGHTPLHGSAFNESSGSGLETSTGARRKIRINKTEAKHNLLPRNSAESSASEQVAAALSVFSDMPSTSGRRHAEAEDDINLFDIADLQAHNNSDVPILFNGTRQWNLSPTKPLQPNEEIDDNQPSCSHAHRNRQAMAGPGTCRLHQTKSEESIITRLKMNIKKYDTDDSDEFDDYDEVEMENLQLGPYTAQVESSNVQAQIMILFRENNYQPLLYYKLIIDPKNIIRTANNALYILNLVRQNVVIVQDGKDFKPEVRLVQVHERNLARALSIQLEPLTIELCRNMIIFYNIKEPLLKSDELEFDSD